MKLSVCILCYNQEKYIEQCLRSVFEQQVDFNFEVVISDDGSTDKSREIITNICQQYPNVRSNIIFREKNLGYFENYINTHQHAIGELICSLDGDDYLLPNKLMKQATFMDDHQKFSMMAHDMISIDENGKGLAGIKPLSTQELTVNDILKVGTIFHSSSVIYRKIGRVKYDGILKAIDYYVYINNALQGPIHVSSENLGAYRVYSGSLTSNLEHLKKCEHYYEKAYELAETSGVASDVVRPAKLKRRFSFALYRCFIGDDAGFRRLMVLTDIERGSASKMHSILSEFSGIKLLPKLIRCLHKLKNKFTLS